MKLGVQTQGYDLLLNNSVPFEEDGTLRECKTEDKINIVQLHEGFNVIFFKEYNFTVDMLKCLKIEN